MRKFKFVGDPKEYTSKGDPSPFIVGHIYNFDFIGLGCVFPISEYISFIGDRDWHEVFEDPTLQDRIQELKAFAKGQGLKVDVVVEYIYIWEGVEYAESLCNLDCGDGKFTKRKIYPINNIGKKTLTFKFDDNCNPINASSKSFFKPSTESAYVEQLKKEANERYQPSQLIQSGDRFELNEIIGIIHVHCGKSTYYDYIKETDTLFFKGVRIYQSGKWAKKLPKRVEVEYVSHNYTWNDKLGFMFKPKNVEMKIGMGQNIGQFLAKQLEKYLNGEVE